MTFFEKELKSLFSTTPVINYPKIAGKTMIGMVDEDILVKISFVTTSTRDQYDAIRVKIINRTEGEIDAETFLFEDIIGKVNGYHGSVETPRIWDNDGNPKWYCPLQSYQREEIADTILSYISMYQNQDLIM